MGIPQMAELLGRDGLEGPLQVVDAVAHGFGLEAMERVKAALQVTDQRLVALLGLSKKTINRHRKSPDKDLSSVASDRLYRVARLYLLCAEVFEDEQAARAWLHGAQTGLAQRVPLDLMTTDAGTREVEALLHRLEYGVLS